VDLNSYKLRNRRGNKVSTEFLEKSSKSEWNSFVDRSPQGSIFCYYEWLEFSTGNNFQILVYRENGKIAAGMPLPFYSTKKIRLPLLTQKMGVLFEDFSNIKYVTRLDKEKKIIYDFIDALQREKKSYSMHFDWHFDNWLPFYWRGYEQTTRYTYVIDFDSKTLDEIWEDMDERTRNSIRKAEKTSVRVLKTTDVRKFYDINRKTFERQGMRIPYSFEYVYKLYEVFKNHISIFEAIDSNGNTHAMNFYIADNKSVYYLMSGTDPDLRSSGAQNLIQWEAIKHYYGKVRYFDFEGSMMENVEANFRKFGAVQKQYFNIYEQRLSDEVRKVLINIVKKLLPNRSK